MNRTHIVKILHRKSFIKQLNTQVYLETESGKSSEKITSNLIIGMSMCVRVPVSIKKKRATGSSLIDSKYQQRRSCGSKMSKPLSTRFLFKIEVDCSRMKQIINRGVWLIVTTENAKKPYELANSYGLAVPC